jgi:iron complex transport system ATP-binding protein
VSLVLQDVTVRRGRRTVLDAVNVTFAPGRLVAVIGPNGAGKSTLLQVAAGLLTPHAGTATLDGQSVVTLSRRDLARRRAYLPQDARADWPLSVERVVALGLTPQLPAFGPLPARLRDAVDGALVEHDLIGLRDRPVTELSGGERGRVMLARATVGDPALLIVDEPTAGLDPRHAIAAARRLRAFADAGRSVIVALHDLNLAADIADDVVALKHGKLAAAGPADRILSEPILGALFEAGLHVEQGQAGTSIRFVY